MSLAQLEDLMGRVDLSDNVVPAAEMAQRDSIREAVALVGDSSRRTEGMRMLRKALQETPPPIDMILDSGVTPIIIHFLRPEAEENDQELLFEASWTMLNLMSGDEAQVVRAIQKTDTAIACINLLSSEAIPCATREHAAWCISNIAGTGHSFRMALLAQGCLPHLVQFVERCPFEAFDPSNGIWAIGNLARDLNGERPPLEPFIGCLTRVIRSVLNGSSVALSPGCVKELLTTVSMIVTDSNGDELLRENQLEIVARLLQWAFGLPWDASLLIDAKTLLVTVTGNLCCASDTVTMLLVQYGLLDATVTTLHEFLRPDSGLSEIRLSCLAAWVLSNFAATGGACSSFVRLEVPKLLSQRMPPYHFSVVHKSAAPQVVKLVKELWITWLNLLSSQWSMQDYEAFAETFYALQQWHHDWRCPAFVDCGNETLWDSVCRSAIEVTQKLPKINVQLSSEFNTLIHSLGVPVG